MDQQGRWFAGIDGLREDEPSEGDHGGDVVGVGHELRRRPGRRLVGELDGAAELGDGDRVAGIELTARVGVRERGPGTDRVAGEGDAVGVDAELVGVGPQPSHRDAEVVGPEADGPDEIVVERGAGA